MPSTGKDSDDLKTDMGLCLKDLDDSTLWLCQVFVAASALSLVAVMGATLHCSTRASHRGGFSCCGAWALGEPASVVVGLRFISCGS